MECCISVLVLCCFFSYGAGNYCVPEKRKVLVLYSSLQCDIMRERSLLSLCNLELLYEDINTSTCEEQTTKAVSTFIEEVFMNSSNRDGVVATVGPSCTDSAYAIARLASRREIPMVHLHTSPSPSSLAAQLSSSFGILGPVELLADASIALIQHANWSRVIALYQDTNTEMNFIFNHLRKQLNQRDLNRTHSKHDATLGYSSILHDGHIPLKFVLSNFAIRVIFLMLERNLARKVLCEAYHLGAIYPEYQCVVFMSTMDDLVPDGNVIIQTDSKRCNRENVLSVLNNALFVNFHSAVSSSDVLSKCMNRHPNLEFSLYHCSIMTLDGLLNSSGNVYNAALELGLKQLQRPEWNIALHQIVNSSYNLVAKYSESTSSIQGNLMLLDIKTIFEVVDTPLAITAFLLTALVTIVTVLLHILTFIFRNEKPVKANSPCLLCVGYIGAYIISVMANIYFVQKSFFISSDAVYVYLCQIFLSAGSIGLTLVFGTVLVRTWRLYQIFVNFTQPGSFLSDIYLVCAVLCMTLVDCLLCLVWFTVDPIKRLHMIINLNPLNGRTTSRAVCESRAYPLMLMLIFSYQLVPMVATVWFAYLLREKIPKSQQNFRSTSVIKLVYVTLFVLGFASPLYYFSHYMLQNLRFEFITVTVIYDGVLIAVVLLVFLPPLLPVAKRYMCIQLHNTSRYI